MTAIRAKPSALVSLALVFGAAWLRGKLRRFVNR